MKMNGSGMMRTGENIFKRKDGRWEARYHKERTASGKLLYGFCYGKTYSEAKARMERAKFPLYIAECDTLRTRYFCIRNSENFKAVFTSLIITQQTENAIL